MCILFIFSTEYKISLIYIDDKKEFKNSKSSESNNPTAFQVLLLMILMLKSKNLFDF